MSIKKYKVGDKVMVIQPTPQHPKWFTSADTDFQPNDWIEGEMDDYIGEPCIIVGKDAGGYLLTDKNGEPVPYSWLPEWLEDYQTKPDKIARYDNLYMDIAYRVAQMSYGRRAKVGAVLVKDGRILSMGWNGMPSGFDNNCEIETFETIEWKEGTPEQFASGGWEVHPEDGTKLRRIASLITRPEVLHAELNCYLKIAKSTDSSEGATLYVTLAPCIECSKIIIQSGTKRVVFGDMYRCDDGIQMLRKVGIEVNQINPPAKIVE